jgi:hypothetical protein
MKERSNSQKLRDILFRQWEENNGGIDNFDEYYKDRMQELIGQVKQEKQQEKMSDYTAKGTLDKILPVEEGTAKGTGKPWKKINFIVKNNDGYEGREKIFAFEIFGADRVDKFLKYNEENTEVAVKFEVNTNEYNGRYYTSLSAFRVDSGEKVEQATQTPQPIEEEESENLPF